MYLPHFFILPEWMLHIKVTTPLAEPLNIWLSIVLYWGSLPGALVQKGIWVIPCPFQNLLGRDTHTIMIRVFWFLFKIVSSTTTSHHNFHNILMFFFPVVVFWEGIMCRVLLQPLFTFRGLLFHLILAYWAKW